MSNVVLATSEADALAAAAVEQHHAQLAANLALRVETLLAAAEAGNRPEAVSATADLVTWCHAALLPHALAEEKAMYPAAHGKPESRLLIDGMLAEHAVLTSLVEEIAGTTEPVRAAAAARALLVLFNSHLAKENDQMLPLLSAAPDVSLADLLDGMHEVLGEDADPGGEAESRGAGHSCACGATDGPGYPELDAREVPHAIRHATIFGALDGVRPGGGMVLVAPHDPLPLLTQVEQRMPGRFDVEYLERGPQAWRLAFFRRTAA